MGKKVKGHGTKKASCSRGGGKKRKGTQANITAKARKAQRTKGFLCSQFKRLAEKEKNSKNSKGVSGKLGKAATNCHPTGRVPYQGEIVVKSAGTKKPQTGQDYWSEAGTWLKTARGTGTVGPKSRGRT